MPDSELPDDFVLDSGQRLTRCHMDERVPILIVAKNLSDRVKGYKTVIKCNFSPSSRHKTWYSGACECGGDRPAGLAPTPRVDGIGGSDAPLLSGAGVVV
jgi:hypothetical protein